MEQYASESDSDSSASWVEWYASQRGNEFFCKVDEDYILDRFNLAGLSSEVPAYSLALDLITDNIEHDLDQSQWAVVDGSSKLLYGLVHARVGLDKQRNRNDG